MEKEKNWEIIQSYFRNYYEKFSSAIFIDNISEREFCFIYRGGQVIRHISFTSLSSLRKHLEATTPLHSYASAAVYSDPSNPSMTGKGWKHAELVFDIDADHLDTPCREKHNVYVCQSCGAILKQNMKICPNCNSEKIKEIAWICPVCLEKARKEAEKLIYSFLIPDLGVKEDEILIVFTGHRGYHVKVSSPKLVQMGSTERKELVSYLYAEGLKITPFILNRYKNLYFLPSASEGGWRGRIAKALLETIKSKELPNSLVHKEKELETAITSDLPKPIPLNKRELHALKSLIKNQVEAMKCHIDRAVTGDVNRLTRIPGSLHGKTGLRVVPLSIDELDSFDPLFSSIAFRGNELLKVKVYHSPQLYLGGEKWGPFNNEIVELPLYVAVFLILKNVAEVAQ